MAKDDMEVIIYKILSYLYECSRNGKVPMFEDMAPTCDMFNIPERYWNQIMEELIDNGYTRGVMEVSSTTGMEIKLTEKAGITIKGAEYLKENSRMRFVAEFLGKGFELLLSSLVAALK